MFWIAEALSALGVFTPKGLRAVADIWGQLDFVDIQTSDDNRRLKRELLERLDREQLIAATAEEKHIFGLFNAWQMPMYNFDFALIPVTLEELQREQNNLCYAEVGVDHS